MCIKLLFDQNLSYRLVSRLENCYPNSVHIESIGLATKDSDFNDICMIYGFPPHIIWLRVGNSRVTKAEEALLKHKDKICSAVEENTVGIIEIQ